MQTDAHQHPGDRDPESRLNLLELSGDVFDSFPEALVDVVSCSGLKRSPFTQRLGRSFPGHYENYKRLCLRKKLVLSEPLVSDLGTLFGTRWVITLPIKSHWQEMIKPTQAKAAIAKLIAVCAELEIGNVAFPIFDGPPPGWLQAKLIEELAQHPTSQLHTIYLFREEQI